MDEKLLKLKEGGETVDRMKCRDTGRLYSDTRKKKAVNDLPFPWKAILLSVSIVFAMWSFLEITLGLYFYNN